MRFIYERHHFEVYSVERMRERKTGAHLGKSEQWTWPPNTRLHAHSLSTLSFLQLKIAQLKTRIRSEESDLGPSLRGRYVESRKSVHSFGGVVQRYWKRRKAFRVLYDNGVAEEVELKQLKRIVLTADGQSPISTGEHEISLTKI